MKKTHPAKAFVDYLKKIGRDKSVFDHAKCDLRLSQIEQKIIQSWGLLRTAEFERILALTENSSSDNLIQSQIFLVRGIALHNSGQISFSIALFEKSIELMEDYDLRRMKFIAYFNLFNACQNLKWYERLPEIIKQWQFIPRIDLNEDIAIKRSEFRLHLLKDELKQAQEIVSWLEGHIEEMSELNRLNFHIDLFDLYVKQKDFQSCSHVLVKMKKFRSYHYGAHFKYLKALVDFHLKNTPFYIYERDFSENKILFYELSVLKCLEEKDHGKAIVFWVRLQEHDPTFYMKGFETKVKDNLFAMAVSKLSDKKGPVSRQIKNRVRMTKEELVIEALKSESRIEKNKLYELVWGHSISTKSELAKLQLIISRINKKGHFLIKYRKGCYHLAQAAQSAS